MSDPQQKYFDDQNVFNVDFDELYDLFIVPVDFTRSHFNARSPDTQELNTPQYQESRCHTFYRMIGFPVVSADANFHSPGYDPNLNTDSASIDTYQKIDKSIIADNSIIKQFNDREQLVNDYGKIFAAGGISSQAIILGSIFIRSFKKQFAETDPLVEDKSQTQTISERSDAVKLIYPTITSNIISNLKSRHLLKPFVVDPRIDASVRPIKNTICAPFLNDKSQTKIFQSSGQGDALKRPFIEKVITVRLNNSNIAKDTEFVKSITAEITASTVTDAELLAAIANPLESLHQSELVIFNNYFKIIKIIISKLIDAVKDIQNIKSSKLMNFNPIPNQKGIEFGAILPPLDPSDKNNQKWELDIINLTQLKLLSDISFDTGLNGVPDPGDFVFSNLEDSVFSIHKNMQKSYEENINKITNKRDQTGSIGIDLLRNIEIIMGEFGGIGLIDMIAIQSALWIMPIDSLLGLIDKRAFDRMNQFRPNIRKGAVQDPIFISLTNFEKTLKTVYLLIQDYYDSVHNGSILSVV